MKNETIDYQYIADLLNGATWSYVHCGDRIKDGDMEEYLSEIECYDIPAELCEACDNNDYSGYDETQDCDLNAFIAANIADRIGQSIVNCVYPSVSFIAFL